MAIERIRGRLLGSDEIVEFEHDDDNVNTADASGASCESNLVAHARRMYPDVAIIVAPPRRAMGGKADGEKIVLFAGRLGVWQQETLLHETWHQAEKKAISQADLNIVYGEVARGDSWDCDYLDEPCERAARAFAHYASARAHGLNLAPARKGTAQAIFERVFDGTEHADLMKRRRLEAWEPVMGWVRPAVGAALAFGVLVVIPHFLF
jgi:hypothetical protein